MTFLFLGACSDSDSVAPSPPPPPPPPPPPVGMAVVTPGINPAFDTVDEIATSDAADGAYAANADATYNAARESVTFPDGAVPSGGSYVRVTGDATIGGVTSSYTVYTYVASNTTDVAATEFRIEADASS